ncbi:hypothetical protein E1287_18265 [Actinomadura sp. KC06]|uniref:non-ribosomal peptide synthetase n=1 Tax=Actinomadura sp. KC06 TaxID=2530369 RepID=UPI00104FED5E|nr:AMP-binding protein [Actinomadura sp. KC06]TDD33890.1 hypothetical protein E1287_18265 [Actinomadura sp. KC06]
MLAGQEAHWFLEQLVPGSPANVIDRRYRVVGKLNIAALDAAWRSIVDRHDILRTTFDRSGGRPVPVVNKQSESAFVDHEIEPGAFDLTAGPLARLAVKRETGTSHIVQMALHRSIADDETVSLLRDELSTGYGNVLRGCSPIEGLPSPAEHSGERRRPAGWWSARLSPAPEPVDLPADRPRLDVPSPEGGVARFGWDFSASSAALLAAFQALLHRYSQQDRVPVCGPVSLRTGSDHLPGPFTNLVVWCSDISSSWTFAELVDRIRHSVDEAKAHRDTPFADVVRELRPARDPRRIPLCAALFVPAGEPERELRLPGASVRRELPERVPVHHDLTLRIDRTEPTVSGSLEYRASMYDPESASRIVEQLHTLLGAGIANPNTPIRALPLDNGTAGSDRIAEGLPAHKPAHAPAHEPVHEMVRSWAERRPYDTAVVGTDVTLTYGAVDAAAAELQATLQKLGCGAGTTVAVQIPPGPEYVTALLGVFRAGGHVLCLNPAEKGDRSSAVLTDMGAQWLVTAGGGGFDVRRQPGTGGGGGDPDRAYIAHTSGSTGRPKGIAQSHAALAQFASWMRTEFAIGPGARVAQWAVPSYDASLCEVFMSLVGGGTLYPVPQRIRANPDKLVAWLEMQRITHFQTVPSFAREILAAIERRNTPAILSHLTHVLLAGEALSADLAHAFRAAAPAARVVNLYGPTESILATWHEVDGTERGMVPVGMAIPGRQVVVVDERDEPCPAGVPGEIVIRGPFVARGYLGATADQAAFLPLRRDTESTGSYRTGDRGRFRWNGELEFLGRRDFQIKLHGKRLELSEVETALAAHPGVVECGVVPVAGPDGSPAGLVAHVVPAGAGADRTGLVRECRDRLRGWFGGPGPPVAVEVRDRLPRTVSGKIDRRRLSEDGHRPDGIGGGALPPQEKRMAEIWSEMLVSSELADGGGDFFSAGGHSMLVPILVERIYEVFGVRISPWKVFENPSLHAMAQLVERNDGM